MQMMHEVICSLQPHYGANEGVIPNVWFIQDKFRTIRQYFLGVLMPPSATQPPSHNHDLQNLLQSLSESKTKRWSCKRLKYGREQTVSPFFSLKALLCHVLFKLPSAGTPIYTSPWGPIALCLPFSIQAAYHSSITHSSLYLSPFQSIHPQRTQDKTREETMQGRLERRSDGVHWQRRGEKEIVAEERVWPCVRLMYLWRKVIVNLLAHAHQTHTDTCTLTHKHTHTPIAVRIPTLSPCRLIHYCDALRVHVCVCQVCSQQLQGRTQLTVLLPVIRQSGLHIKLLCMNLKNIVIIPDSQATLVTHSWSDMMLLFHIR